MSATDVVVEETLKPDGSLERDSKLDLPPGRVQLIVQPLPELPKDDPFWQMMQGICAARAAAGLTPRDTEEVEAQRSALREDVDEEIAKARRLQEESIRLRRRCEDARGESMIVEARSAGGARCTVEQIHDPSDDLVQKMTGGKEPAKVRLIIDQGEPGTGAFRPTACPSARAVHDRVAHGPY